MRKHLVAPSLLSADFSCLRASMEPLRPYVDWWHIDVMDGCFVPNITLGPFIIEAINKITDLPLDVHLMIKNPLRYLKDFVNAGANYITAHIESFDSLEQVRTFISQVKDYGVGVGLSVKPNTKIDLLDEFLSDLDLVLIMTVEPGFGGQQFMPEQLDKVSYLKERFSGFISVDGGINSQTAKLALSSGATVLVAGSYIFNSPDPIGAIKSLRQLNSFTG